MNKKDFLKKCTIIFSVLFNILFGFIFFLWQVVLGVGRINLAILVAIHLNIVSLDSAYYVQMYLTHPIVITTILLSVIFSWDIWIYIQ